MVKRGCFQVELVDAETKKPFKEHSKEDDYKNVMDFAECEPDTEFLIRVKLCAPAQASSNRNIFQQGDFEAHFVVDNQELAYRRVFSSPDEEEALVGLCSRGEDGITITHALKFMRAKTNEISGTNCLQQFLSICGKVQVRIYKTHCKRCEREPATTTPRASSFRPEDTVHVAVSREFNDKLLRSTKGSKEFASKKYGWRRVYERGQYLDTFTIYYCTTVGLLRARVLPTVDMYEEARLREAHRAMWSAKRGQDTPPALVTPESKKKKIRAAAPVAKKVRKETETPEGEMLVREVLEYDLTQSDEEAEDADSKKKKICAAAPVAKKVRKETETAEGEMLMREVLEYDLTQSDEEAEDGDCTIVQKNEQSARK